MYEYNGKQYSIQEIESLAKKAGYDDYLSYIDDYPGFKEVEETIKSLSEYGLIKCYPPKPLEEVFSARHLF